ADAEDRPRRRVPRSRTPSRRSDRTIAKVPCEPALLDQAVADSSDTDFLASRRGGRDVEEMASQPVGLRSALRRASFDTWPPGRCEYRRERKDDEQGERRMNRGEQTNGDNETQNPRTGREERHVHVIEHEDLVAQNR